MLNSFFLKSELQLLKRKWEE